MGNTLTEPVLARLIHVLSTALPTVFVHKLPRLVLIAAAPDLLAVAIEVERLLAAQKFRPEGIGAENKLLAAARAAITKATGGAA